MSAEVISLGCRMNLAEGERIRAMLGPACDTVVINSCAVTAEAVRHTRQAIRRARRARPDARLLVTGCAAEIERDAIRAMPEIDGLTVLDRWRKEKRNFPVLVLTARDSWSDKVAGLDAGADDYLAKPFQTEELIARLRALIRRASGNASSELIAGKVRLDTRSGRVTLDGEPVKLTAQEYKLLSYLLHHKGKVVSRTELIEHIYDQDFDRDSNTIEVFVTRIRKKLGSDVISTIRGLGYSLDEPGERPPAA